MTANEINQAIAEACGRQLNAYYCSQCRECVDIDTVTSGGYHVKCGGYVQRDCPNYVGSLDAMAQAEETRGEDYCRELLKVAEPRGIAPHMDIWLCLRKIGQATAAQRAEAFLKTLGKWKD